MAAARRGQVRATGCRATASPSPASATHDHSTTGNGSKSGNGRQTLLISHVNTATTPAASMTISGTHSASQRTETAPAAPPPDTPRRSQPRPRALRPAASQTNASSAPASNTTGSGPAISDQSSGFIAPLPAEPHAGEAVGLREAQQVVVSAALTGLIQAEYQPYRGRLARPVRAEEPGDPAGLDHEGQLVQGQLFAVPFGEPPCLDHCFIAPRARAPCPLHESSVPGRPHTARRP